MGEVAYFTFKFDREITLESIDGTNQYLAIRVKFLAQGINGYLKSGLNP